MAEPSHIQLTEYRKTTIPYLNWMFEDIFCLYGISIPYYLLDFSFPDYPLIAEWPAPYTPEYLELYRPGMPSWPEMLWPEITGMVWPEMNWPALPRVQWPRLPDMLWPELPPWPEMDLQEWERFKLEWPEWDWPEWQLPESERTRWRGRRPKKKEWPQPWWPFKPEWQRTWPYKTEWRGIPWLEGAKWPISEEQGLPQAPKPEEERVLSQVQKPDWYEGTGLDWVADFNGFNFNIDQGESGYNLPWLNELLGQLFDEADLPRIILSDLSPQSIAILNDKITELYEAVVTEADYTFYSQTKDAQLEKLDTRSANGSWDTAWTEMEADTPTIFDWITIAVGVWGYYEKRTTIPPPDNEYWGATKERAYISFDTSSLAGKTITAATLKIYISSGVTTLDDYETNRTVNLYTLAWDTLDASDWAVGTIRETFLESALSVGSYYTITLTDTSIINQSGETQFQFAFKADVDGDTLTDPIDLYVVNDVNYYRGGGSFVFNSGNATSNKPILTVTATG